MAWLSLRLTEEEKEKIREKSEQAGMSISDYTRAILLSSKNVKRKQKINCEAVKMLAYEINRIGVNINQIAKKINSTRDIDIQVLETLKNIEYELAILLEKAIGGEERKNDN